MPRAAWQGLNRRPRPASPAVRSAPDPAAETSLDPPVLPAKRVCSEPQLLIRHPVVGHVALDRGGIGVDASGLTLSVVADGRGKSRIRDVMRGVRHGRYESARHFMFALRAGLEALQLLLD